MFMLIVEFEVQPENSGKFATLIKTQAHNSLTLEPECHFFEVERRGAKRNLFVLSEVYTNKAAFQEHLESAHFLEFDDNVADWVIEKKVRSIE